MAEIKLKRKKIFFVAVYRSPNQNSEEFDIFLNKLQDTFDALARERPHAIVITGDFNCRSSQWWAGDTDNSEGHALVDLLEPNNLYQLINEPTNIRGDNSSCIDLIITNQPNIFIDSGVLPSLDEFCQHQIVYGKINVSLPSPPPFRRTIWDYHKADVPQIQKSLNDVNWITIFNDLGVNEMVQTLTDTVLKIISSYVPHKSVKFNNKDLPWITPIVKTAIKRNHRVYNKFKRRGRRDQDWINVKRIRNETTRIITRAKQNYYLKLGSKLSDPNQGIKTYWSILNRLVNKKITSNIPPLVENDIIITNVQTKTEIFNTFFANQCSHLTNGSTLPTFYPNPNFDLHSLTIDESKILALLRNLNTKKAHGSDKISAHMIKLCDSSLVKPLSLIFQASLSSGVYPSIWKQALVIPVHKKGNRQDKSNCRPISLLPIFSKILEKLIFDNIYAFLSRNNLLSANQSGFRPGDSTINQLLSITHKIYCAFDETPSKETRAVFLDLSKVFDRVWHDGLIYKLQVNGISGNLLNLLCSFLTNRQQQVILNGKTSASSSISAGVPQGSVLGPLLFLIYINDLSDNIRSDVKLFADDTSLFSVVSDINDTADKLNRDLEMARIWAWQWKMEFNPDKTQEIVFTQKQKQPYHPPLLLGNCKIAVKNEHKHLGLILDSKLNFQQHIKEASSRARRGIGLIKFLRRYVSRDTLNMIYKLYVRPHLDYGDIIFHHFDPTMKSDFTLKLESIQYSAALAVTGCWRGSNRQRLYDELGWETLYHRRWYRRLCHFFKLLKTRQPEYLFSVLPPERQMFYNLRHFNIYDHNFGKTFRFSNTYFPNTLKEWNCLDESIRNSGSIAIFKHKLLNIIRPKPNSLFNIYDLLGTVHLTRLRIQFSPLNEHKFRHNFNCTSPLCTYCNVLEDNEHFLLHCHKYSSPRDDLLESLSKIPLDTSLFSSQQLCQILLYGSPTLNKLENKMVLESTVAFIKNTKRLDT